MENHIADIYWDYRLKDIECGLPITTLSIYLGHNGDYFEYIGNNTGMIKFNDINEIIEKFGLPVEIDLNTENFGDDFKDWQGFLDQDKLMNYSFRDIQNIKNLENLMKEYTK